MRPPVDKSVERTNYPRSLGRVGHGHMVAPSTKDCGSAHGHLVAQTYIKTCIIFPLATLPPIVDNMQPVAFRKQRGAGETATRSKKVARLSPRFHPPKEYRPLPSNSPLPGHGGVYRRDADQAAPFPT